MNNKIPRDIAKRVMYFRTEITLDNSKESIRLVEVYQQYCRCNSSKIMRRLRYVFDKWYSVYCRKDGEVE